MLETSDIYVMQFFNSLQRVVMNAGVDTGTEESKTDSLVNLLLIRAFSFDGWPFGVRIKERYKLTIAGQEVSANPDFVVDMNHVAIIVTEDKHLRNVSPPNYGESQILAEILACGCDNSRLAKKLIDQTIYAIRVISSYVTFYKAEIPKEYWEELENGLPRDQNIEILRWPGKNYEDSGLDLAVPEERYKVLETITKIRQYFLQSAAASTTASTSTAGAE